MKPPSQPNASVEGGIELLILLSGAGIPLTNGEVARRAGMAPVRANRLLKTLSMLGMVYQRADRSYEPGPGLPVLAAQAVFGSGLLRAAMEPVRALRMGTAIVAVGVLWRDRVAYQYHGRSNEPVEDGIGRMGLFPAADSSIGRALLAELPAAEARKRLGAEAYRAVRADLARARRDGLAMVRLPDHRGETSIAIACGRPRMAGLAMSGNFSKRELPGIAGRLRAAGRLLDRNWLGERGAGTRSPKGR